jgi:hypothetical protein
MRAYIEFARKAYMGNMVYRFDYIIGIINTIHGVLYILEVQRAVLQRNRQLICWREVIKISRIWCIHMLQGSVSVPTRIIIPNHLCNVFMIINVV